MSQPASTDEALDESAPENGIDFRVLLASSPNPYVVMDPSLRLIWMNDAYLRVTMRTRAELIGKTMFEAFPSEPSSESHRLLHRSFQRVLETGETDEIALIRYDIPGPKGEMNVRYWSATHTPLNDADGEVAFILQHTVDVTELHGLRTLRDEMGLKERAESVQARNLDLAEETTQLRTLFEQAPGFVAVLTGAEHTFELANQAYRELVGNRDVVGLSVADALPEVIDQGFVQLLDSVMSTKAPYVGRRVKVFLDSGGGGSADEPRYLDFIYQPIIGADGGATGVFVQGHEVTQQVEAEERQKLLINELNHRVKNTLSIVQGLAMQSFRKIENSAGAQQTFESRLNALSAAHGLLTERSWKAASLVDTIDSSLRATAGQAAERTRLSGPDITLTPQAAVSMAMIVHELSTNAIKYGALSAEGGHIDVEWTIEPSGNDCLLTIVWQESGGPPVAAPERRGFGTRLIERGLSGELKGKVTMDFRPQGLCCTMSALIPAGVQ